MNFLAFETSSETVSVAVSRDGRVFARDIVNAAQQNAELALPTMHALMREAALTMADIDAVTYGQGPGSFTGVRIACGLAQGLAYGLGKRVCGVTSLRLLAEQVTAQYVLTAIDARMGEIYLAVYKKNNDSPTGVEEIVAPQLVKPVAIRYLLDPAIEYTAIGSAFDAELLRAAISEAISLSTINITHNAFPRAADLIAIATRQFNACGFDSFLAPEDAAPLYLRNNVAMTIAERAQFHADKKSKLIDSVAA
jgi:tRNA threonylcarbamoyladenosine biosynthesis protein TsaB